MLYVAWVISCVATYFLGYHNRKLVDAISELKVKLTPKKEEPAESIILDPEDLAQRIRFEHEQKLKELNPEQYE